MKNSNLSFLAALPLALLSAGAMAKDHDMTTSDTEAVKTLESKLPRTLGFHADLVHVRSDGVACINYRVANDNGGESHEQAVVDGDKVLRSTPGNSRFEKAWNKKCANED